MNQRLVSGVFVLAISLAVVGAIAAADDRPVDTGSERLSSAVVPVRPVGAAQTRVPLRSGFLDSQAAAAPDQSAMPVVVRIGKIGLEAPILSVGVDDRNQFAVPAADTVGWYKYGSAPGSAGSTVLAAHVDYGGREGAFFNLQNVTVGELLEVEMADGTVLQYRVTDSVLYDKKELPADDLFRKGGDPVLQLITCGGTFDSERRSYKGNLVVTAEPVQA